MFISHADAEPASYNNLAGPLGRVGIECWNPTDIRVGDSVAATLRAAITGSGLCVFAATRTSVESTWCHVELGAFWVLQKKILVHMADSSLAEADLPDIVRGSLHTPDIDRVVESVRVAVGGTGDAAGQEEADRTQHGRALVRDDPDYAAWLDAEPDREWRSRVLWVNGRHGRNDYERNTLNLRYSVTTVDPAQARDQLRETRFRAVVVGADADLPAGSIGWTNKYTLVVRYGQPAPSDASSGLAGPFAYARTMRELKAVIDERAAGGPVPTRPS